MDDRRYQEGFLATGGVLDLALLSGVSQTLISSRPDASAQRALSVETVMDVANAILWPQPGREQVVEADSIDMARAQEYSLLAILLARAPLTQSANNASAAIIERKITDLFAGVGCGGGHFGSNIDDQAAFERHVLADRYQKLSRSSNGRSANKESWR